MTASPATGRISSQPAGRTTLTMFAAGSGNAATKEAGELASSVAPGTVVGNYRVLGLLASGGMGEVFVGEHLALGRRAAIKLIHRKLTCDPEARARFAAEALATARIRHPGVVSLFDFGPFEDGAYLVTELLHGETLAARLWRQPSLPIPVLLDLGARLADALDAAHQAGVVHRDLKPENIFLVADHSRPAGVRPVVIDFGVAKLSGRAAAPVQTLRGDLLGTPIYMAPEQSLDAGAVDHRCDIYSLGCVLYQLLTGGGPFGGSVMEVLMAHQKQPPAPPSTVNRSTPPVLEALVLQMMAKAPEHRPSTMHEVGRALDAIAWPPVQPTDRRWFKRLRTAR